MNQSRPAVLTSNGRESSAAIPRQKFVDNEGNWLGWADIVVNRAGDVSDWHFHPSSVTYVYVIRGSLTVKFGPDGSESVVARAGDFLQIPANTIHQELTSPESDLEAFVVRIGGEPEEVAVRDPRRT